MKLYGLKNCDTCRAAIKALGADRLTFVDIRADGVAPEELTGWCEVVGVETLVNRRSTTWRGLSEAERAGDPIALLSAHPTLIKRPVIVKDSDVFVGWSQEVQTALGVG